MVTLKDIVEAHRAITEARERYRELLRAGLADGVTQSQIARALDVTRETVRRDALPDDQREALRRADAERKRERATKPVKMPAGRRSARK